MIECSNRNYCVQLQMPRIAISDDSVDLRCTYELDNEALYSIKYYRDGQEFYRFIPRDPRPVRIFPRRGLRVEQTAHFHNWIRLLGVTKDTGGVFKCEVSLEGSFETYSDEVQLSVQEAPKDRPELIYQMNQGGVVQFTCKSPRAIKGRFTWIINGRSYLEEDVDESVSVLDYDERVGDIWIKVEVILIFLNLGYLY